jgi:type II secretory pathway pseudopilin PulG
VKRVNDLTHESGFTLIEVLVAGFVLVVGVLGVALMVNNANAVTSTTRAREGATNLARELLEQTRALPYSDLTTSGAQSDLQARGYPDDDATKSGWQIRRRGVMFDVTILACTFDDAHDGARSSGGGFCPGSVTAGSTTSGIGDDPNPDDYRRVEFDISWSFNGGPTPSCAGAGGNGSAVGHACVAQAEMIANPSGGLGPSIKTVTPANDPVEAGTSVSFHVVTESPADSVTFDADDGTEGTATMTSGSSGLGWDFTWDFSGPTPSNSGVASPPAGGNVIDGTHTVITQAFLLNAAGVAKPRTVALNRYLPRAPQFLTPAAGVNTRVAAQPIVEFSWLQNPDTDIWGYQVYRAKASATPVPTLSGATPDRAVCSTGDGKGTTCFDPDYTVQAPTASECPSGTPAGDVCANYYVVAFDKPWSSGNPSSLVGCPVWGDVATTLPLATTVPLSNQGSAATRRPGCPSAMISVDITAGLANKPPDPPTTASPSCTTDPTGLAVVKWTPPVSPDPVDNEQVLAYRVYRDASSPPAYTQRTNLLSFSGTNGYTDPTPAGSSSHTYYVTSVDERFQESQPLALTWTPGACP